MATVVVIPGSFAPPSMYDSLVESLSRNGIQSEVVGLPSVGRQQDMLPATMVDDVEEIVSVVEKMLEQDRETVILTHSYAGVPGTQSLEKLSCKTRQAEGKKGGVGKIIYMSAVVLPVGGSVLALLEAPGFLKIEDDYMTLEPECAPFVYSDLIPEEALKLAKAMPQHSTAAYRDQLTYAGYEDVEVHCIVCEEDKLILPVYQYGMVDFLKGAAKGEVGLHKLQSGHAPNISQPDNVTRIVEEAIGQN
ncbi:hypothetical protein HG530_015053 [Fusarium avenaceum]|nr:hypothetical protein HG530_015053 [Fusarium avenaceum]